MLISDTQKQDLIMAQLTNSVLACSCICFIHVVMQVTLSCLYAFKLRLSDDAYMCACKIVCICPSMAQSTCKFTKLVFSFISAL